MCVCIHVHACACLCVCVCVCVCIHWYTYAYVNINTCLYSYSHHTNTRTSTKTIHKLFLHCSHHFPSSIIHPSLQYIHRVTYPSSHTYTPSLSSFTYSFHRHILASIVPHIHTFSTSDNVSYACCTFLNVSGSPPLSGCNLVTNLRNARRIYIPPMHFVLLLNIFPIHTYIYMCVYPDA